MTVIQTEEKCRLCGSQVSFHHEAVVLSRFKVRYWKCTRCDLIQTDKPWWLSEAYSRAITATDTGAIARNVRCASLTAALCTLAGIGEYSTCMDYGGGHGVFVRMMRDRGLDYSWADKYAQNLYSSSFEAKADQRFDLVTAFEVFEHMVDVRGELSRLFKPGHDFVLVSTQLHRSPSADWWYFMPVTGQHVAFFSRQTMQFVAAELGYEAISSTAFTLFIHRRVRMRALPKMLLRRLIERSRGDRLSLLERAINQLARKLPPLTSTDIAKAARQITAQTSSDRVVTIGEGTHVRGTIEQRHPSTIRIGRNCLIEGRLVCSRDGANIEIGDDVYIGPGTTVDASTDIRIGSSVLIAYGCTIVDHDSHSTLFEHRRHDLERLRRGEVDWTHVARSAVTIGSGAWIGARAIVLKGVSLGDRSVLAAGAVATRSFPPDTLVAGNPAKKVRAIDQVPAHERAA